MPANVLVYTETNGSGKWSRYHFPFRVDDYAILGKDLYLRSGDDVLKLDDAVQQDFAGDARAQDVDGVVQWSWLDLKRPGIDKHLTGLDLVGDGVANVQIGYDERNPAALTDTFVAVADSNVGHPIPMDVTAPSMSVKLTFTGGQAWNLKMASLYVDDTGGIP